MTDQKAARTQWTESVQRRREIWIRELGALQILHEIGIEAVGVRIHGRAIDADVPAVIDVDCSIVGEIDEHQERHQHDQAGKPDVASPGHIGRGPWPLCCP
ncbi:hypothetical protein [Bradyrhizobium guangdongense]|uniref:hypothetical protein n=1 Tax=Bradyrhizobium guangdongense TaxID=1325090 RepID=UPI0013E8CD34|nr:hypothetical protein [Bradyrhizobium guangdongense]